MLRLGQFHTIKAFLAVLGKRLKDAGLSDVLVESGAVALGSVATVLNGNHNNRSVRSHKLMYEALQRLCWRQFLENTSGDTIGKVDSLAKELHDAFPSQQLHEIRQSQEFNAFSSAYDDFISQRCAQSPTFEFWVSYMCMVETLLQFLRASREGNWELHLAALRSMVP